MALALLAGALVWAGSSFGNVIGTPPLVTVSGEVVPTKLPRSKAAPAALRLGFTSEAPETHTAPELSSIAFQISRHVTIQTAGLQSCPLTKLYSAYASVRQTCAGSLVGQGRVISEITLPGQAPVTA